MNRTGLLKTHKIIIFTLLIIGIILLSPIISKEVYAKTGKLPAQLSTGLFKGLMDDVTKELRLSEGIYTETAPYKHNDTYIRANAYNVSPAVTEGDEFWTAKGSKLQQFDKNYQPAKALPTGAGTGKISGSTLRPYLYEDLRMDADVFCAFRGIDIFQRTQGLIGTFNLPAGSELAKRLEHFIARRNAQLGSLTSREQAFGLNAGIATQATPLDDYGISHGGPSISRAEMLKKFGYTYTGTATPTYPYVIKEIEVEGYTANRMIVPVVGNEQAVDRNIFEQLFDSLFDIFVSEETKTSYFNAAVQKAVKGELGILYDGTKTLNTPYNNETDSVADSVGHARTHSFYQFHSTKTLTPQSAFALAVSQPKPPYPSLAQQIMWTTKDSRFIDPRYGLGPTNYVIDTPEGRALKALSEAFEAHYNRLVEWKNRNNGKYIPKFGDTKRNIIFNAKSETYQEGAWLVGPYKIDYLLSHVTQNNQGLYFAGMENMQVFGEFTDSAKKTKSIKEIQKWSYFVPLKTSEKGLTAAEVAAGLQTTSLKFGVPEPNQEFYIEIPYDENLLRIAELKANFKALDYDATGSYFIGMGEYIDFEIDVAVEKLASMSHGYIDVKRPTVSVNRRSYGGIPGDVVRVTLTFSNPVFLTVFNGTKPGSIFGPAWTRSSETTIYRDIPYTARGSNLNSQGFYYKYEGVFADGTGNITGGFAGAESFSKPYTDAMYLTAAEQNQMPRLRLVYEHMGTDKYEFTFSTPVLNPSTGGYQTYFSYNRTETARSIIFNTPGGQSMQITIPKKSATVPDPDPGGGGGGGRRWRRNNSDANEGSNTKYYYRF